MPSNSPAIPDNCEVYWTEWIGHSEKEVRRKLNSLPLWASIHAKVCYLGDGSYYIFYPEAERVLLP